MCPKEGEAGALARVVTRCGQPVAVLLEHGDDVLVLDLVRVTGTSAARFGVKPEFVKAR
jgi:hypothetical protein